MLLVYEVQQIEFQTTASSAYFIGLPKARYRLTGRIAVGNDIVVVRFDFARDEIWMEVVRLGRRERYGMIVSAERRRGSLLRIPKSSSGP